MPTRLRLSCRALLVVVLVRPNFYSAGRAPDLPPATSDPVLYCMMFAGRVCRRFVKLLPGLRCAERTCRVPVDDEAVRFVEAPPAAAAAAAAAAAGEDNNEDDEDDDGGMPTTSRSMLNRRDLSSSSTIQQRKTRSATIYCPSASASLFLCSLELNTQVSSPFDSKWATSETSLSRATSLRTSATNAKVGVTQVKR